MNAPVSAMDGETSRQLDLLAIFHYVLAGITGLLAFLPIIHLAMGIWMVSGGFHDHTPMPGEPPISPEMFGWIFVVFASAFILFGLAMAVLLTMAGRRLKQRRSHTFCLVVAGIACINMPLGTVLGVFTLVVLSRPGVRDAFAAGTSAR